MRLIDADALKRYIPTRMDMQDLYLPVHFRTLIDEQPTVDAVPKWIPCSERLPESYGKYIVTRGNSVYGIYVNMLRYFEEDNPCWYFYDSEYGDCPVDDVIAWMPLPEPYKTDGKEK